VRPHTSFWCEKEPLRIGVIANDRLAPVAAIQDVT
jgi:hypothetical protein